MFDFTKDYIWTIYDPQLDVDILAVPSYEDEAEDIFDEDTGEYVDDFEEILLPRFALQLRKAKPFLEKYGLIMKLQERYVTDLHDYDRDLSSVDLSNIDDSRVIVEALPPKKSAFDCDSIMKEFPWMSVDESENIYPLYWKYNRDLRKQHGKELFVEEIEEFGDD